MTGAEWTLASDYINTGVSDSREDDRLGRLITGRRRRLSRRGRDFSLRPLALRWRSAQVLDNRTDQHIANDATCCGGDERQHEDAEEVQFALDGGDRAAQREHERTDEIQRGQEQPTYKADLTTSRRGLILRGRRFSLIQLRPRRWRSSCRSSLAGFTPPRAR